MKINCKRCKYLILGGGPTGLGAATRLRDLSETNWFLLEATHRFGGLAHSWVDEAGFTWDLGGHVQFSHYETFDRYMDEALGKDGWYEHERESWVRMLGTWVPYPFQNNLHRLPAKERWECVKGLLEVASCRLQSLPRSSRVAGCESAQTNAGVQGAGGSGGQRSEAGCQSSDELATCNLKPETFKDWILATFGEGVAEHFMLPYNYKVWAYPPETMDFNWIGERVSVPPLDKVLHSICTGEDAVSWGPNATFRFPKSGGTGAVWTAIGKKLPPDQVKMNTGAVKIDVVNKVVFGSDGSKYHYENLISTIPLNQLIGLTEGNIVPLSEADKLVYSATHVVGLGIDGETPDVLKTKCWMYFPEANSPYYRVTVFTNYSPENAAKPGEQWSLMTETSESDMKKLADFKKRKPCGIKTAESMSDADFLKEWTIRALEQDGILPEREKIVSVAYKQLPQGYPTPWKGRDHVVGPILRTFESVDVYTRGRFGAWKYEVANQDHCFAQGYECVNRIHGDRTDSFEYTLNDPNAVNSRKNP